MQKCFRSTEQQHELFDCPYQCGMRYKFEDLQREVFPNEHSVQHNDIVVMTTDGVTDNLFDEQIIEQCIEPHVEGDELPRPEDAAICISMLAEAVSYSKTLETPWIKHAEANGERDRMDELGGKPDDITVIVAQIKLR